MLIFFQALCTNFDTGSINKTRPLEIGHHGSRTSTSEFFIGIVNPQYAVISASVDNSYGHPHKEVTDMLKEFEIPYLATYENGTIIIQSDGENIKVEY